jgi:hypothetical protein
LRSGTSFAAPFLTATVAVARLRSTADGSANSTTLLQSSAVDLGAPGRDPVFGWGLVNADGLCASSEEASQ